MKEVYVGNTKVLLLPDSIIGEGGEAEVYDAEPALPGAAVKIWKQPSHPDYAGTSDTAKRNREWAKLRLNEYAEKLLNFPKDLPKAVVGPIGLATVRPKNTVVGYAMPFVKGAEVLKKLGSIQYRRQSGTTFKDVTETLLQLWSAVNDLHRAAVIGDFNNLNVLFRGHDVFIIDADSMQWGKYRAAGYTARFLDPLLADPKADEIIQIAPHSASSDWYAFALMLFESLLMVHPYGGVFEPKKKSAFVGQDLRPLKRISVLSPEVIYPKKGVPYGYLPDDLLHFYSDLLQNDVRGIFPQRLLQTLRFTRCTKCGTEHARNSCPVCATSVPIVAQKAIIRGKASVERIFAATGDILEARYQNGILRVVSYDGNRYLREDGSVVMAGAPASAGAAALRFRPWNEKTVAAFGSDLVVLSGQGVEERLSVDLYRGRQALFDTNSRHLFWVSQGRLLRNDLLGPKFIGNVLRGQTQFWTGEKFGFGFSRAGALQIAFVFDSTRTGINDSVKLPPLSGELIDAHCTFTDERCWSFITTKERGELYQQCSVVGRDGMVYASAKEKSDDGSWLDFVSSAAAVTLPNSAGGKRHALFVTTDRGIVRIEEVSGTLSQTADFPDTAELVSPGDELLLGPSGLTSVGRQVVRLIKLQP